MELLIESSGNARCVYSDTLPLANIGKLRIERASHVEPNDKGEWIADLSLVFSGPILGPFLKRTDAIAAEVQWLHDNWLLSDHS